METRHNFPRRNDFPLPTVCLCATEEMWGVGLRQMPFLEDLPEQCPPAEAVDVAIAETYRVVYSDPPAPEHFASFAKLGRNMPPKTDPCVWAACSLFTALEKAKNVANLPKVRSRGARFIAKLAIPAGSGVSLSNAKDHVSFWMYDTFDPCAAALEITKVGDV